MSDERHDGQCPDCGRFIPVDGPHDNCTVHDTPRSEADDREREWQDVALKFEGTWETSVNAADREEAVRIAKRTLWEELEPISASIEADDV